MAKDKKLPQEKGTKQRSTGKTKKKSLIPRLSESSSERVHSHVREKLLHTLEKGREAFPSLHPPGFGSSWRGLGDSCHYLSENRLEWWANYHEARTDDADQPLKTDAIREDDEFVCEFMPGLASFATFEGVSNGDRPELAGNAFTMRSSDPGYSPRVRRTQLQVDDEMGQMQPTAFHAAAVLERQIGGEPDPGERRPTLIIEFHELQRAVGLSFGFLDEPGGPDAIPASDCRLIAYDVDGRIVTEASGGILASGRSQRGRITKGTAFNHLGVTDRDAGIAYVELEFYADDDDPETGEQRFIQAPQLIFRVWHEPFPAAAVNQGFLVLANPSGSGLSSQTIDLDLPFRCSAAAAVLRGFAVEFTDGPVDARGFSVRVEAFHAPDGWKLVAHGDAKAEENAPWRIRVDYAVLAWDKAVMEVEHGYARFAVGGGPDRLVTALAPDPCGRTSCDHYAACLSGFGFFNAEADDLERIRFRTLQPRRGPRDSHGYPRVAWPMEIEIEADADVTRRLGNAVLFGGSPVLGSGGAEVTHGNDGSEAIPTTEGVILVEEGAVEFTHDQPYRPWREPPEFYFQVANSQGELAKLAFAIQAEMALASIGTVEMEIGGSVRSLDVEVRGTHFDGEKLLFDRAGGVSKEDVEFDDVGNETDNGERHSIVVWPQVSGLVRTGFSMPRRIETQGARYEGAVENVLSLSPTTFGALRNAGSAAMHILGARVEGDEAAEFSPMLGLLPRGAGRQGPEYDRLRRAGNLIPARNLADFAPVTLGAGQILVVGGACLPGGPGVRRASLILTTDDHLRPTVSIDLETRVVESQADGLVVPNPVDFGNVPVGQQRTRNLIVLSIGRTALLVTDIGFQGTHTDFDHVLTGEFFESGTPDQVDPGDMWPWGTLTVRFTPSSTGTKQASFRVQTNAGALTVAVSGKGV